MTESYGGGNKIKGGTQRDGTTFIVQLLLQYNKAFATSRSFSVLILTKNVKPLLKIEI